MPQRNNILLIPYHTDFNTIKKNKNKKKKIINFYFI